MAEELVAAADGEHGGAVADGGSSASRLVVDHVGGHHALVAVLAAADVEEVVSAGVEALARPGSRRSEKPIPRHSQRRCRKSMLPRSA